MAKEDKQNHTSTLHKARSHTHTHAHSKLHRMSIDRLNELRVSNPSNDSFSQLDSIERGESVHDPLEHFLLDASQLRTRISTLHLDLSQLERSLRLTLTDHSVDLLTQLDNKIYQLKLQFTTTKEQYDQLIKHPFPPSTPLNSSQQKLRTNKLINLGKALESAIVIFSDIQRTFHRNKKDRLSRIIKTTTGDLESTSTATLDSSLQFPTQFIYDAAQERDPKLLLQDYQLRHEDLIRLENGMQEIHTMFLELSHLVTQQGELIEQVEQSVTQTNEYTEKGVVQIEGATKKAKFKRTLKIIIFCIILALIIFLICYVARTLCCI